MQQLTSGYIYDLIIWPWSSHGSTRPMAISGIKSGLQGRRQDLRCRKWMTNSSSVGLKWKPGGRWKLSEPITLFDVEIKTRRPRNRDEGDWFRWFKCSAVRDGVWTKVLYLSILLYIYLVHEKDRREVVVLQILWRVERVKGSGGGWLQKANTESVWVEGNGSARCWVNIVYWDTN